MENPKDLPLSKQYNRFKFNNIDDAIEKSLEITHKENLETSFYYNSKKRTVSSPLMIGEKNMVSSYDDEDKPDILGEYGEFHTHPSKPFCFKPSIPDVIHWIWDRVDEAMLGCTSISGKKHIKKFSFETKEDALKIRKLIIPKEILEATEVEILDDIPKDKMLKKGKRYIQKFFSYEIFTDIDNYMKERGLDAIHDYCKNKIVKIFLYNRKNVTRKWEEWKPSSSELMFCLKESLDETIKSRYG